MSKPVAKELYETDFYAWTEDQARKLRSRAHNDMDWDNLAEEIDSVGRSQKNQIRSRLIVLLAHLLKWQFQPERRGSSWQTTIGRERTDIDGVLADSPSLRSFPAEVLADAYAHALRDAARETMLPVKTFPASCPYGIAEILNPEFMPGETWDAERLIRD